jgi:hypothetical protein
LSKNDAMEQAEVHSVTDILDKLEKTAHASGQVKGSEIVHAFGNRSYGPLLTLPPLLEISPLGGVPGVATAMALIVVVIAVQMVLGRRCCWLPRFVTTRSMKSTNLARAVTKMRPLASWLDRWFHGRLRALTTAPFVRAAGAACILLALTVPFLDLVPFASTAPMAAVALFGLALLMHDGALMIAGSVAAAATLAVLLAVAR